jgi:hypothetical protein
MYYDYRLAAAQSRMDDFRRDAARRRLANALAAPRKRVRRMNFRTDVTSERPALTYNT